MNQGEERYKMGDGWKNNNNESNRGWQRRSGEKKRGMEVEDKESGKKEVERGNKDKRGGCG